MLLIKIVTSDGRRQQRIVGHGTRRGSIPVIGFADRARVTVIGIGIAADGKRGPGVSASAARKR